MIIITDEIITLQGLPENRALPESALDQQVARIISSD